MAINLLESVEMGHIEVLVQLLEGSELMLEAADGTELANFVLVVPSASLGLISLLVDGIKISWDTILSQGYVSRLVISDCLVRLLELHAVWIE